MSHDTAAMMAALRSERLLADSHLLTQITDLRQSLTYKSDGDVFSYDDYYFTLQKQIEDMSRVALKSDVAPHTEAQYQVQLTQALEAVFDDSERILSRLLHFVSKLKVAEERMETLKASFVAWYSLAANQHLQTYDIDLGTKVVADLARAEFERLMEGLDVEVKSMIEAVKVQIAVVNKRKKTAEDKFNLGKDQANAVWTSRLLPANAGTNSDPGARELLVEAEEEEEQNVPDFVSRDPKISEEVSEVRGVFEKRGDPQPTKIVGELDADND